jgi:hypothetical protein
MSPRWPRFVSFEKKLGPNRVQIKASLDFPKSALTDSRDVAYDSIASHRESAREPLFAQVITLDLTYARWPHFRCER